RLTPPVLLVAERELGAAGTIDLGDETRGKLVPIVARVGSEHAGKRCDVELVEAFAGSEIVATLTGIIVDDIGDVTVYAQPGSLKREWYLLRVSGQELAGTVEFALKVRQSP